MQNFSINAFIFLHVFFLAGFKCPVCSKFVSSDEMDLHLVLCLTKPRVTYNGRTDGIFFSFTSQKSNQRSCKSGQSLSK